jgi:hypothetical protein
MTRPFLLCALIAALIAAWAPPTRAGTPDLESRLAGTPDLARDAVPGTVERLRLQTQLPHESDADDNGSSWRPELPSWLTWILAAASAGILFYVLVETIPAWRSARDEGWGMDLIDPAAPAPTPAASLAEADALAGQGRFVEAMHLLLLHSLAELRRRLRLEFSDSLTSREILRRAQLPDEATVALRGIVTRVESSYFGDHPAARPDYESCRGRYEELAAILGRSPAPAR